MATDATELKYAKEFVKLYKELYANHYKKAPVINTHRDLWGFRRMFDDLGKDRAREVIDYYFGFPTKFNHSLTELFNNYDRYAERIDEIAEDEKLRLEQRRETKQRVKEWQSGGERTGTTS